MKVMLFGGTGFVGKRLQEVLKRRGHEVLVRDVRRDTNFAGEIGGCDAVVNLAGAGLFAKRWSPQYKEAIYNSRIFTTRTIVDAIGAARGVDSKPTVLVNASAIGIYGERGDELVDETSEPGADFLARLCYDWEDEAHKAQLRHRVRTVVTRFGIILGKNGGALAQLLTPFKAFVGGPIGNGRQWMSWIHLDDACGLIAHAIENNNVEGPLNAVAPNPVTNKEFSKELGASLNRPSFMPVPKLGLYALVGEAAGVIAGSQKVQPKRTLESGYRFLYEHIKEALDEVVNDRPSPRIATTAA